MSVTEEYIFPMSYAQRRLWFLDRLEPGSSVYTIPKGLRLTGALNVDALGRALTRIVDRHESLRTTFREVDGVPSQVIAADGYDPLRVIDLSTDADPEGAARRIAVEEATLPFDLAVGPLFRARLLILAVDEAILLVTMSHLVSDGWSMGALVKEAAALYAALAAGEAPNLPALDIQYADYSEWQREREGSADEAARIDYWKRSLAGAPPRVDLPTDRPRPAVKSSRGAMTPFVMSAPLVERLKAVCRDRSATLYMGLLAAFGLLMSRYGGQADVPVATLSANRNRKELEPLIGFFVNTLPLRLIIDERETFGDLLDRARIVALGAYDNQDVPFDRLVEAINPERSPGFTPLVNVMMTLQNAVEGKLALPGVRVAEADLFETRTARFDLELYLSEDDGAVRGECVYNTDLFDAATVARMMESYVTLVESGVAAATAPLASLPTLSPPLRRTMIETWNETDARTPDVDGVIRLFERQAAATPEAPAILCGDTTLSYDAVNRRANRLARALAARGAGPGEAVAVMAARSPETVIALLAILKTGAAYAPIDPSYPDERRAYLLADCGAKLLVADRPERRFDGVAVDPADIGDGDETNLPPRGVADDIAYLIYTSGSTGRPKGVQVSRRSHVNYIVWAAKTYAPEGGLVFPLFTSLAFDLTVTSIYVPLVSGGAVAVYPERSGADGALLDALADNRADVVKLTPAHLAMVAASGVGGLKARRMILGGEELKTAVAKAVVDRSAGGIAIFNEYGPTETTVGCMIHRFDPAVDTGATVPIGVPAPNVKLYILDAGGNPTPPGVVGELFVAGVQVAAGYRNRPDETAARFLPDPFHAGLVMYKTGDRARWRADGIMEYRGRNDDQVKIQGYRIEPGEVESALTALDGIDECVVLPLVYDAAKRAAAESYCVRCGLPSAYPGSAFDETGLCAHCRQYDLYREKALAYFKTPDRFMERFPRRGKGAYDCLALFSGGKDSAYMLCRLVEAGLRVFAYTFDNGYLYDGAKENIKRTVAALGIDHAFGTAADCKAILADSLARYSNVCNSCFKAVLTYGMREAKRRGIDRIVTGLSRGQLFETRLAELFNEGVFDEEAIDAAVKRARAVYHRMDDAVSRSVVDGLFDDDAIFDEIEFVDFYRYTDVSREEILAYLTAHGAWVNPTAIAGCTTNCLVNDVGVWVHSRERGYNNYALPNSWEVRLGHKERQLSIDELNAPLDEANIALILSELGHPGAVDDDRWRYLAAYYTGATPLDPARIASSLAATLPSYLIPSSLVHLDRLPLTPNGKVDKQGLAAIGGTLIPAAAPYVAPRNAVEEGLAHLWMEALGLEKVGVDDNLFHLGGHSLMATRIVSRARERFGVDLPLMAVFENPTVSGLAAVVAQSIEDSAPDHEMAALMADMENLSDEEIRALLEDA
jgi:amino acid adenylation domain-containing protein